MGSLIIKPVQRIMKYPLLLRELWQATPEDHPDCRPLQEAFTAAKIINVNINEFKRRKDIGEISFTLLYILVFITDVLESILLPQYNVYAVFTLT